MASHSRLWSADRFRRTPESGAGVKLGPRANRNSPRYVPRALRWQVKILRMWRPPVAASASCVLEDVEVGPSRVVGLRQTNPEIGSRLLIRPSPWDTTSQGCSRSSRSARAQNFPSCCPSLHCNGPLVRCRIGLRYCRLGCSTDAITPDAGDDAPNTFFVCKEHTVSAITGRDASRCITRTGAKVRPSLRRAKSESTPACSPSWRPSRPINTRERSP